MVNLGVMLVWGVRVGEGGRFLCLYSFGTVSGNQSAGLESEISRRGDEKGFAGSTKSKRHKWFFFKKKYKKIAGREKELFLSVYLQH
jgi:hypothetical protein